MYALRVQINDERAVIGGADDLAVLSAIVGCVGKLGTGTAPSRPNEAAEFHCRLGGLTSRSDGPDEHLTWISNHDLGVGDIIRIEIVAVDACDPAIRRKPADPPVGRD